MSNPRPTDTDTTCNCPECGTLMADKRELRSHLKSNHGWLDQDFDSAEYYDG